MKKHCKCGKWVSDNQSSCPECGCELVFNSGRFNKHNEPEIKYTIEELDKQRFIISRLDKKYAEKLTILPKLKREERDKTWDECKKISTILANEETKLEKMTKRPLH